jgi:hypothetical protein
MRIFLLMPSPGSSLYVLQTELFEYACDHRAFSYWQNLCQIIDFIFPEKPENRRKNTILRVKNTYKRIKARGWENLFIRAVIQDFELQLSDDL